MSSLRCTISKTTEGKFVQKIETIFLCYIHVQSTTKRKQQRSTDKDTTSKLLTLQYHHAKCKNSEPALTTRLGTQQKEGWGDWGSNLAMQGGKPCVVNYVTLLASSHEFTVSLWWPIKNKTTTKKKLISKFQHGEKYLAGEGEGGLQHWNRTNKEL